MSDYCPNCMEPIGDGWPCPNCGNDGKPPARIAHHLPAGTVLSNGRYLVGRALGQGGFGITYIGRDLTLNMRVAIKEYFPTLYVSRMNEASHTVVALNSDAQSRLEAGRSRFLDEARALARFHDSPGIVDVRDFFEQNETAYIVMDYLEGETLRDRLRQDTIDADQMFELVRPVLDALELMHAENVIHRDISPDNIMLRGNGQLCLMDFGAAHELEFGDERTVSMVLKSGYAPEEQYRARGELGPWTDIYALCATMYRAITGVAPDESLQRAIGDEMLWPSDLGIRISPAQEAVLKKGMAPKRSDRYQSIAEMRQDFDAAIAAGSAPEPEPDPEPDVQETLGKDLPPEPARPLEEKTASDAASPPESEPEEKKATRGKAIAALAAAIAACLVAAAIAYYLLAPAHTIAFDAAGGSSVESATVNRIDAIDAPEPPARKGYEFVGWYLDDALSEEAQFPLKVDADTTLHAAWKKTTATYRVEYVDAADGSQIADPKVVEDAKVGSEVTEKRPNIEGYVPVSKKQAKLTVSEDDSKNVMTLKYRKIVGYEVKYLDKETEAEVAPSKTVEDAVVGTKVTEAAPEIDGYTLESESEQSLKLARDADQNVIVFYYEPEPVPVEQASYEPYYGGGYSGGGSGGSSTDGGSNGGSGGQASAPAQPSGANDVDWAN